MSHTKTCVTLFTAVMMLEMSLGSSYRLVFSKGFQCHAPQFNYGAQCRSPTEISGSFGSQVFYQITSVTSESTTVASVCCKGWTPITDYIGIFHDIGCGSSTFFRYLQWGDYTATPIIQCYSNNTGAQVTWFVR
ncbi:Hypothetical predicted protein [Mytilus galloprovincialis]|uniref:Uncharacterized protein n=2 Tax=Mytilus galloprovincialis TaxID=29158 RepID=A0A8B6G222_MYTGA|nr:Hypothetical predicted protein [Mytilus galloprovincialis]